ncbi:MAG: Rieske 2Fe-2S domain-containing protein [Acidobacteriaceae bacterium]
MSDLLKHPGESRNDSLPPEAKAAAHSRRTFLFKLAIWLNAAVGTVLAVPLVGFLLGPVGKKDSSVGSWVKLGDANDFPVGETRLADFESPVAALGDGDTAKVACWVRRVSARKFQVFAVNCAHLGCPVRWFAESKLFMCPCHGGAYYADGARAAGPPQRGLFEYRTRLDGDALAIHAGDMPTLATQASCKEKPLIQIAPVEAARPTPWQA